MTRNKLRLAIDTQIDFIAQHAALPVPGADQTVGPGIPFLQNLDRDQYAAALFTSDTHSEKAITGSPENLCDDASDAPRFPIYCLKGPGGWDSAFLIHVPQPPCIPPTYSYISPMIRIESA